MCMWNLALNSFTCHVLGITAPLAKREKEDWTQFWFWVRVFAFLNQCIFPGNTGGCVCIKPKGGDASFKLKGNTLSNVNNFLLGSQGKFLTWYLAYGAWVFCVVLRSAGKLVRPNQMRELTGVGTYLPTPLFPGHSWAPWGTGLFSQWAALWVGLVAGWSSLTSAHNAISVSFWAVLHSREGPRREKVLPLGCWSACFGTFRMANPHSTRQKPQPQTSPSEAYFGFSV